MFSLSIFCTLIRFDHIIRIFISLFVEIKGVFYQFSVYYKLNQSCNHLANIINHEPRREDPRHKQYRCRYGPIEKI